MSDIPVNREFWDRLIREVRARQMQCRCKYTTYILQQSEDLVL